MSGQLQAAAALLVELARAASASSVELAGSNPLLTANTAAVLHQEEGAAGRLAPAFPTLYPQLPPGMGGDRNAGTWLLPGLSGCWFPATAAIWFFVLLGSVVVGHSETFESVSCAQCPS